jgi:hypothetical protein
VRLQSVLASQVIVVVDHNAELLARVRNAFTGVAVIDNRERPGLSDARNAGLKAATGEVVAFLDDDAVAAADWLETLLSRYSDENVVAVGGAVRAAWRAGRPPWFPAEFDWVVGCSYVGLPTTTTAIRNLIGCNMSFRRRPVLAAGGFQVGRVGELAVGCEDDETELCIRLRERRPYDQIIYEPQAVVHHSVPSERSTWSYFWTRCWSEGLSKALVAQQVGQRRALSSETFYALQTLPVGFLRGIRDCMLSGQVAGLLRAFAIATGLCTTVSGYLAGRLHLRSSRPASPTSALRPPSILPEDVPSP